MPRGVLAGCLGGGDDFWDDESKRGGETGETAETETENETETETENEKWSVPVLSIIHISEPTRPY